MWKASVDRRLRLKYQPRVFFCGIPERFYVPQGSGFRAELEGLLRCDLEKFCKSLPELIERRAAKAAAEKFEARTAQSGRVQRDRLSCTFAYLNEANPSRRLLQAFLRDCLEHEFGGLAPEVVEDDINSCFRNFGANGRDEKCRILFE